FFCALFAVTSSGGSSAGVWAGSAACCACATVAQSATAHVVICAAARVRAIENLIVQPPSQPSSVCQSEVGSQGRRSRKCWLIVTLTQSNYLRASHFVYL